MEVFKTPKIPLETTSKSVFPMEVFVVTPERPPIAPSPGVWQDLESLEGWGSVGSKKQSSTQGTRHRNLMTGIGLKEKDLDKIYNYKGDKWIQYSQELTYGQLVVAKQIRRQYRNSVSAVASRKKKGRDLDLIRELLEHKIRQRDSLRARNEQLKVRLEEVKAKKEALIQEVIEKNPKAFDPVKQGFCTMREYLDWFRPGK